MSFIFPPADPQFVPRGTNFVVKQAWEISSNEDGVERTHYREQALIRTRNQLEGEVGVT